MFMMLILKNVAYLLHLIMNFETFHYSNARSSIQFKQTFNFLVIWLSEKKEHLLITPIFVFKCSTQPYIFIC